MCILTFRSNSGPLFLLLTYNVFQESKNQLMDTDGKGPTECLF